MSIFSRLFKKKEPVTEPIPQPKAQPPEVDDGYQVIPAFIPTDPKEYQLVSVIATAIAAGDAPDSQFVVKKILKRNPEAQLVTVVAASLAAGAAEDSQMIVKTIKKKK